MRNCILPVIICMIIIQSAAAQCPTVSFSLPDSVCAGQSFTATNTSTSTGTVDWDACTGDLSNHLYFQSSVNVGPLGYPQQIKAFKDNGKYYVLIVNQNGNNLMKYDYGNSLTNTPIAFNYGNFGGILANPNSLDAVKENGTWYAMLVNNSNQRLIRVDLGVNIDANIATATDLGTFGLLGALRLKVLKENNSVCVFVMAAAFTRIEFGNSITNTPIGSTVITGGAIGNGMGFDVAYDCSLNKYIGFYANQGTNIVQVIDFGSTTANTPSFPLQLTAAFNTNAVHIFKDGPSWHVLATTSASGGKFLNFKMGSNLLNNPTLLYNDTITGLVNPQSMSVIQDSSDVYCLFSTIFGNSLTAAKWSGNCSLSQPYSNDPVSFQVMAGIGGYQKLSLKVTDSNGNYNWYTDSVFVNPIPNTFFVTGSACEGSPTAFIDSTTVAVGSVSTWQWDFGDGSPVSTQQNPIHLYSSAGTYPVSLTTQSSPSCPSDTYTTNVTINPLPAVDFLFTSPQCQGYQVPFTDNSQALGGTNLESWIWDFGDGLPVDTLQNPIHKYDSTGTFQINLIVTTDAGCIDSLSKSITITPTPVSLFTVNSTCVGAVASFSNGTTIQGGGSIMYDWTFGDGNSSTALNPVNQYPAFTGNYDVTLIATSVNGCQDTLTQNIRIGDQPVPQFSWTPQVVCQGNQVTFSNTSFGTGTDTISAYLWNFGDNTTSSDENPFHAYADTGYYNVTLTVTSPTACDSSITQQIYVIPAPTASYFANNVCLNLTTSFNPFITTPPGTQIDSVVWTFGDGTTFNGLSSPTHTYNAPGTYEVTLTVYNNLLCTGFFTDSVAVYPLPEAAFNTSLVCSGAPTSFDGTISTVSQGSVSSWLWNFGGLGTATDSVAQFTFASAGTYNVTLIATTSFGCSDTITSPVTVIQAPDFSITYTQPCLGSPSSFTYVSNIVPVPPSNLLWNFGDGTLSSQLAPNHIYATSDSFTVSLYVLNPVTGCASTSTNQVFVKPVPVPGFVVADNCEDQLFQFTDTSTVQSGSIAGWNWNFGVLGSSALQNPSVTPANAGIYNINLMVTTNQGCSATVTKPLTVFARPVAAFTPDPLFGSPPLPVAFINNTSGATSYMWNFGDGSSATGTNPTHMYADTGTYQITMIATSINGCLDTTTAIVAVLIPYLDIAVTNVFATINDGKLNLSAQLANMGNITINECTLRGLIQNGSAITETFSGALAPGEVILYTFQSSYEISDSYLLSYFCIEAINPNNNIDQKLSNNKKCAVLENKFELYSVFPNPFINELNININLTSAGPYTVEMYDEKGKLVLNKTNLIGLKGFNTTKLNTTAVSKGNYIVLVRFRDEIATYKAVKILYE